MNRNLSIALVVILGLLLTFSGFWFFNSKSKSSQVSEVVNKDESVNELPLMERPYAVLTPRLDGHELHLVVTNLPLGVQSLEYELVYMVRSGITQGVPGTVKDLSGKGSIERDLLLGTCSSGKCRYDEGVEDGTFTIRFRDTKGKLVYKFETGFHLQQNPTKITSSNGEFSLSGSFAKGYYLTMGTFGLPSKLDGEIDKGPYGVFTKTPAGINSQVSLGDNISVFTGNKWKALPDNKTTTLGTFVSLK